MASKRAKANENFVSCFTLNYSENESVGKKNVSQQQHTEWSFSFPANASADTDYEKHFFYAKSGRNYEMKKKTAHIIKF